MKNLKPQQKETLKWWAMFAVVMGVLSWIVYHSTKEAYPDLLSLAIGCMIISTAAAAYNHSMGDEPDFTIRAVSVCGMVVIVLLDVANLWGHVSLARDLSASKSNAKAVQAQTEWELKIEKERVRIEKERNDSQAQLNQSEAQLAQAEARKLNALPPSQRWLHVKPAPKPTPAEVAQTGGGGELKSSLVVEVPTAEEAEAIKQSKKKESEIRAEWRWFFSTVLLLTVAAAVLSCFVTKGLKLLDADNNGVPDYVQRIAERNPALAQQLYPVEYAKLKAEQALKQAQLGN